MKVFLFEDSCLFLSVKSQKHAMRVKDIACQMNTSHNKHESIMNTAKTLMGLYSKDIYIHKYIYIPTYLVPSLPSKRLHEYVFHASISSKSK